MDDPDRPGRRLKVTLVVRDETDDPSILDIVRVAFEDGLRTPTIGSAVSEAGSPERHSPLLNETLEDQAREQIEEALAKVIEQFQAAGKEPKFEPAKWAAQLSKVWAVIHKAKAAGVQLHVSTPGESPPPAEGA